MHQFLCLQRAIGRDKFGAAAQELLFETGGRGDASSSARNGDRGSGRAVTTSTMTNQDGCEGSNWFRRQTNNSLAQLLQEQPDMVHGCIAGLKARLSVEQQAAVEAVLAPSSGHLFYLHSPPGPTPFLGYLVLWLGSGI